MKAENAAVKAKRLVIRLITVICLVAVGFWMYHIGKEFNVILDNGAISIDGLNCEAMAYGTVYIDEDAKGFDIWENDRVIKKMVGKNHRLTIKVLNEDDDSVIKTVYRDIVLDFNPRAEMVSLPGIISESKNILTPNPLYSPEPVLVPDSTPDSQAAPQEGVISDPFNEMEP